MKEIFEKMGLFYLGKNSDDSDLTLYKSKDLTTHAMMIGMTGSGKTGLGISLLEEAAIDNIPSIVIDPKGDMGNLCLAFKNLDAKSFEPWLEKPEDASKISQMYRDGLRASHQEVARVEKFARVEKTIYTPGSSAGVSVDILGSFDAPPREVLEDSDMFASLINTTVSSLLALLSLSSSNQNTKEHLLLSTIFNFFWSKGDSLSLEDLIGYVASPPFKKIGVLTLSSFYAQPQRMKLAMLLNTIASSVTFSSWLKGEPLDIQNMLYDRDAKAKVAIFSIAHLNDDEKMFFVSILLNAYINWMRKQRGSSTLKTILYMDEIFGFFPPSKNPPSKKPMMLLLKQARAYGTGVVLSTQNPVDLDYKGLSNIGTWFVGKLQTKQDIDRVLEPLSAKSNLTKDEISKKLQTLKGRHFFMKNVHSDKMVEFSTRWVLSYLKGPMTKQDIKLLMKDKKETTQHISKISQDKTLLKGSKKPILSAGIKEYFLDSNINAQNPFEAYIYASIKLSFYSSKMSIDTTQDLEYKLKLHSDSDLLEWIDATLFSSSGFLTIANSSASYGTLPTMITKAKSLKEVQTTLSNYLYRSQRLELFECKRLKLKSKLGESRRDFIVEVEDILKDMKDEKLQELESKYGVKYERLESKIAALDTKLIKEQNDVSSKTTDTIVDIGLALFGAFFGKRSISATTIRRGTSAFKRGKGVLKEREDVKNIEAQIEKTQEDIRELNLEIEQDIKEINDRMIIQNYEVTSTYVKPRRRDIVIDDIALLWER